jgi:hypothetical protein
VSTFEKEKCITSECLYEAAKKVIWNKNVFAKDIEVYANYGIRNVTTFAVYMDDAYFKAHPDITSLKEYAEILIEYRPIK